MNEKLTIDDLVNRVNTLLKEEENGGVKDSRISDEITVRKVRDLLTKGMIDKPQKVGRNTYFNDQHINQVMAIRKMQLEGLPEKYISNVIGSYAIPKDIVDTSLTRGLELGAIGGSMLNSTQKIVPQSAEILSSASSIASNSVAQGALNAIRSIQEKSSTASTDLVKDHMSKKSLIGSSNYMDSFKTASKSYQEFPLDSEAKVSLKIETGYTVKDKEQILERIKQILNI